MGGFLCRLKINLVIFCSPCCFDKWIKRKNFTKSWIKILPRIDQKTPWQDVLITDVLSVVANSNFDPVLSQGKLKSPL